MAELTNISGPDNAMSDDDEIDFILPPPFPIHRQGGESRMSSQTEFEMNPYRNGYMIDGVLVPEPMEHAFDIYKHLVLEEDSFTRGYITDVPEYIHANGVIQFMQETNYKYSLGCLFCYPAIANAQRQYVQKVVFGR
jgi:hypothetical protein